MNPKPLFALGQVVATPDELNPMSKFNVLPVELIHRHATGDGGLGRRGSTAKLCRYSFRPVCIFRLQDWRLSEIWIITDADRSLTTLLLPHEY